MKRPVTHIAKPGQSAFTEPKLKPKLLRRKPRPPKPPERVAAALERIADAVEGLCVIESERAAQAPSSVRPICGEWVTIGDDRFTCRLPKGHNGPCDAGDPGDPTHDRTDVIE